MPEWIVIEDWDRFQHYRDRVPIWIKNYVELMADDAYLGLTGHQRGVLHGLWLEYAKSRRELLHNTSTISSRLGLRVTKRTLQALNDAGFITFSASKPLASRYQAASPEVEVEKKPPTPLQQKTRKPPRSYPCGIGNCTLTWPSEERAAEHRENVHGVPAQERLLVTVPEDAGPSNSEPDWDLP